MLPGGPGEGIRITDYAGEGGHYAPPEGVDSIDPYAYDIFALGETIRGICIVRLISVVRYKMLTCTQWRESNNLYVPSILVPYSDFLSPAEPSDRPDIDRAVQVFRACRTWILCTEWLRKYIKDDLA